MPCTAGPCYPSSSKCGKSGIVDFSIAPIRYSPEDTVLVANIAVHCVYDAEDEFTMAEYIEMYPLTRGLREVRELGRINAVSQALDNFQLSTNSSTIRFTNTKDTTFEAFV